MWQPLRVFRRAREGAGTSGLGHTSSTGELNGLPRPISAYLRSSFSNRGADPMYARKETKLSRAPVQLEQEVFPVNPFRELRSRQNASLYASQRTLPSKASLAYTALTHMRTVEVPGTRHIRQLLEITPAHFYASKIMPPLPTYAVCCHVASILLRFGA